MDSPLRSVAQKNIERFTNLESWRNILKLRNWVLRRVLLRCSTLERDEYLSIAKRLENRFFGSQDESLIIERESWKREQRETWTLKTLGSGDVSSSRCRHKSRRFTELETESKPKYLLEKCRFAENSRRHRFHDVLFTFLVKNRLPYLDRACVGHMAETGHNEIYPAHGSLVPSS